MALHENRIFRPRFLVGWGAFAAAAGFVNAAAFMASNRLVSHVTGSVTSVATESSVAFRIGAIVLAFILGAMLAMLVVEKLRRRPNLAFTIPLLGVCVVLVVVALAGRSGAFGEFGGENDVTGRAFPMLAFLAMSMGMLNAAVAAATANKIRVTHMTGPATDLAGHVVRGALRSGDAGKKEVRWAWLRFGKLLSFVVGGAVAVALAPRVEWSAFLIAPGLLLVALGLTGTRSALEEPADEDVPDSRHAPAR